MKKRNLSGNEGFTLVELIVVIVILGILMGILVPALLGYIDKAKGQQTMLNGKSVYTAAQADMSAAYAKSMDLKDFVTKYADDIVKTADVPTTAVIVVGTKAAYGDTSANSHDIYTISYVYYQEAGKTAMVYEDGAWEETTANPKPGDNKQYFEIQ